MLPQSASKASIRVPPLLPFSHAQFFVIPRLISPVGAARSPVTSFLLPLTLIPIQASRSGPIHPPASSNSALFKLSFFASLRNALYQPRSFRPVSRTTSAVPFLSVSLESIVPPRKQMGLPCSVLDHRGWARVELLRPASQQARLRFRTRFFAPLRFCNLHSYPRFALPKCFPLQDPASNETVAHLSRNLTYCNPPSYLFSHTPPHAPLY